MRTRIILGLMVSIFITTVQAHTITNDGGQPVSIYRSLAHISNDNRHPITAIAWHPNLNRVAVAAQGYSETTDPLVPYQPFRDGFVKIYDLNDESNTVFIPLPPPPPNSQHYLDVFSVAFSRDGSLLAMGSKELIMIYNINQPDQPLYTFTPQTHPQLHHDQALSLSFSADDRFLAAGTYDAQLLLFDLTQPEQEPFIMSYIADNRLRSVAFNPDGSLLAAGGNDRSNKLQVFSTDTTTTNTPLYTYTHRPNTKLYGAAFNHDGSLLASGGSRRINIFQTHDPQAAWGTIVLRGPDADIRSLDFSSTNKLAVGLWNREVHIYDVNHADDLPIILTEAEAPVQAVAFSHDGQFLATGGNDKILRIYKMD